MEWLRDAGMAYRHYRVGTPRLPLPHYRDFAAFKLFVHDVGLLGAMSALDPGVYMSAYHPALALKSSPKNHSDTGSVRSIPLYALGLSIRRELGFE